MSLLLLLQSAGGGSPTTNAPADPAAATGSGLAPAAALAPASGLASATGTAAAPSASVAPVPGLATGSGSGLAPSLTKTPTVPVWTTPTDGVGITTTPELKFTMPAYGQPLHFWMELDTAATFDTANLRTVRSDLSEVDWSYWDGAAWQDLPGGGVPAAYAGNEARYTVTTPLTSGLTWYRRVKAGY